MDIAPTLRLGDFTRPEHVFHIARTLIDQRYALAEHTHDFAELFWVEHGTGLHHINDTEIALSAGDLLAIRPADVHRLSASDANGFTLVNLAFHEDTLRFLQRYPVGTALFDAHPPLPDARRLSSARIRALAGAADALSAGPNAQLALDHFLLYLLTSLEAPAPTWVDCSACPEWLQALIKHAEQPEHFERGPKHLAGLVNRTPEHVTRELRKHTGLSTIELITRARLNFAEAQLRMTTESITDIALACGFSSLGHFYKLFGGRYGIAPRAYRLRHHGAER
jgi:AraC family transcriptional regulator, dual regulator of chb operon